MRNTPLLALILLAAALSESALTAETITVGTLVREMTDLHRLAKFPDPPYKMVQFSSHNRASVLPGGPGWFKNYDGAPCQAAECFEEELSAPNEQGVGEYLVCDVEGPGAIVRLWRVFLGGTIRVFLDDMTEPFYDGPTEAFFVNPYKIYAKAAGIEEGVFAGTFQQYAAAYAPIPFARRCRIVWTGKTNGAFFHHVQIRRYPPGTDVKTFQPEDLKTYASAVRRVAKTLSDPKRQWKYT